MLALLKEDDHTFTVAAPDGAYRVAKRGLSDEVQARIRAYPKAPHFAEGGYAPIDWTAPNVVDPSPLLDASQMPAQVDPASLPFGAGYDFRGAPMPTAAPPPVDPASINPGPFPAGYDPSKNISATSATPWAPGTPGLPNPLPTPAAQVPNLQGQQPPAPMVVPGADKWGQPGAGGSGVAMAGASQSGPAGGGGFGFDLAGIQRMGERGIQAQAAAEAKRGVETAAAQQGYQAQLAQQQAQLDEHLKAVSTEMDNVRADIQAQRIDPHRLWSNMNSGQRATAAIGMILGGIGEGLIGGGNPAIEMLNRMIDRDVDAQKVELGKKENLLAGLQQKYGNQITAANAARLYLTSAMEAKINEIAARTGSEEVKGRAMLAVANLRQSMIGPSMQIAQFNLQRQMMQQGMAAMQAGAASGSRPTMPEFEGPMGAMAKAYNKDTERMATAGGRQVLADSPQAAEQIRTRQAGVVAGRRALEELGKVSNPAEYHNKRLGAAVELARAMTGSTAPSSDAVEHAMSMIPSYGTGWAQGGFKPALDMLANMEGSATNAYASVPQVRTEPIR